MSMIKPNAVFKLSLKQNKGFSWFKEKNIFIKGYYFDNEGNYYEKENLTDFFINIKNEIDFLKK